METTVIYRLQDYKYKDIYHTGTIIQEVIDKVVAFHNDEYIRWSLENWTKADWDKIKSEVIRFDIPLKDGNTHTSYLDMMAYRFQQNWIAKRSGLPIPYPETQERPKLTGVGLMEQVVNKTYYGKKQ